MQGAGRTNLPNFAIFLTGAAGVLCIHDGVALFGGSGTVPELRRRGLQAALLHKRNCYACDHGCDLAMTVAQPGSDAQRNAERKGFRLIPSDKLRSGFHRAEPAVTRFYSMQIYFGVVGIIRSFAGLLLCVCRKSAHYRGRSRSWPCRCLSGFITLPTG